ncbi:MerR family transcriptional regulator [Paenibacillus radicis (ex Gao et al. 2016)]|uniref:Cu(I)-responsive transcriptional regulator n=1 Tax=Paenibacillus radicis (ex Gao et al. 2016) TaxID=1737354 RepID=A0A917H7N8_9BACL|nr:MerR family transcriptional regulator [Paenibacillus radicis (ex Gao et al. 2016)]GGG70120.1 Cu(I)-responsive transcriptional regulator [Paenibacillus radicis (ex Gao et al. 2016)]
MKIHVLAQKTGLTPPTIRYYEKEGLLTIRHVVRGENNYRDYTEEAVEHLQFIKRVQKVGFTLMEIKAVMEEKKGSKLEISRSIELLREKMIEMDSRKLELEQAQALLSRMLANKRALLKEKG